MTMRYLGVVGAACLAVASCTGDIGAYTDTDQSDTSTDDPDDPGSEVADPSDPSSPTDDPSLEIVERTLSPSRDIITNPDRGFYAGVDLLSAPDMSALRQAGYSLVIAVVRLDDYRDRPLDDAFFDALQAGFDDGRAAGVKFVLRFSYNASFTDDAPLDVVLQHIEQLAPYLRANEPVISVMQAGFIGAWGEWHGSTNGLDTAQARATVLDALLDAVPKGRFVQVRTPMYKEAAYPGGPITDSEAFTDAPVARVGHHNDCFLASESDLGTYASPVQDWMSYVADDTRYAPIGGETCQLYPARTDCSAALAELQDHHWSYLNSEYRQEVLDGWEQQGCADEIDRRLGYRFAAKRVMYAAEVAAGGMLPVEIELDNDGFAAAYNERPVYVVLTGNGTDYVHELQGVDLRQWQAGQTQLLGDAIQLPDDLAAGTYSLALWLPDNAPELTDDPRYSVRLANSGVWDAATGYNLLADDIVVSSR